jgi:hypothetical protein
MFTNHPLLFPPRRSFLKFGQVVAMALFVVATLASVSAAQDVTATTGSTQLDGFEGMTYVDQNGTTLPQTLETEHQATNDGEVETQQYRIGTQTVTRTMETEHHVTGDGELEIQRYRAPAWDGDERLSWEREVRTRKLPDGTVEREYVLRAPDGAGQLVPIGITREKTTPGSDSTIVQQEELGRLGGSDWQVLQKEQIVEKGSDNAKEVSKQVQRLETGSLQWRTIELETSSASTSRAGDVIQRETKSVRQTPDAFGTLTDFERRQERTVSSGGNQTRESTVHQRDPSTTESDLFLLDHTTDVITVAPDNTTRHVVRESDLLFDRLERNMDSRRPEVVEDETRVEKTAPDGIRQTVTKISGRTAADPSTLRPLFTVLEESDTAGYVRRIYIPAE